MAGRDSRAGAITTFRRGFERALEVVVLLLMAALAVIVIVGVIWRKAGFPLIWYDEVASVLLAWLTYYGACWAALHRRHIGFPTIVESAPPKVRRFLIVIREIIVIGFFVLAGWTGWLVVVAVEGYYLASAPWISRQLTHSVIPIGAALFIIAEILSLVDLQHESAKSGVPDSAPTTLAQGGSEREDESEAHPDSEHDTASTPAARNRDR